MADEQLASTYNYVPNYVTGNQQYVVNVTGKSNTIYVKAWVPSAYKSIHLS